MGKGTICLISKLTRLSLFHLSFRRRKKSEEGCGENWRDVRLGMRRLSLRSKIDGDSVLRGWDDEMSAGSRVAS